MRHGGFHVQSGIIAVAIGAAAAGTTFWLKTGFGAKPADHVFTSMPPIQEMQDKAHLQGLPVQEVREPF
jgi:hypothetical protein